MRSHTEGQSSKSRDGYSFQQLMHNKLKSFLDRESLDNRYKIEGALTIPCGDKTIKPDHVIRRLRDQKITVCCGSKKSFRERWKEDDRDAMLFKYYNPDCWWVEFHGAEKDTHTSEQTEKFIANIFRQASFDAIGSLACANVNSMRDLFVNLARFLREYDG